MTTVTKQTELVGGVDALSIRMYRQMVAIRLFEERVNDLYTRALCLGWRTSISARRPWPSASARR